MAIRFTDYVATLASLKAGESTRVNHKDCKAGVDTKKRLYLTRAMANRSLILGYCHNCQTGGSSITGRSDTFRPSTHYDASDIRKDEPYVLPSHLTMDPAEWGGMAQRWRIEKKIRPEICQQFGIGWDHSNNSIVLPIYEEIQLDSSNKPVSYNNRLGHQVRHLELHMPKYTTVKKNADVELSTVIKGYNGDRPSTKNVLVEDYISGIKVAKAASYSEGFNVTALVNYGTQVKPHLLNKVTRGRNAVWLDNDNEHVLAQAELNARVWKMLHNKITHVMPSTLTDPKQYTLAEIKGFLR